MPRSSARDKGGGTLDKAKGRVKEAVGTLKEKAGQAFADRDLEDEGLAQQGEGKIDRAKGAVKNVAEDVKDAISGGVDALKKKRRRKS